MKNDDWIRDRIAYLKGLKARTEQQELLVLLADNPARTAQDSKKLSRPEAFKPPVTRFFLFRHSDAATST